MKSLWLVLLVGINLIWSAHPVMTKLALGALSPLEVALYRYGGALLAFLGVAVWGIVVRRRRLRDYFLLPQTFHEAGLIFLLGFAPFCFAPLLQGSGLVQTQASDNALIIAMEPLITVFLAWWFFRERPDFVTRVAFGIALAGFVLLSGGEGWGQPRFLGNLLVLVSLLGESTFSVVGRALSRSDRSPVALFGTGLLLGVLSLFLVAAGLSFSPSLREMPFLRILTLGPGQGLSGAVIGALFWLGPLGTAACYGAWLAALKQVQVASLALTLFVQPLAGVLWGASFAGDRLSSLQWLGALLLLGAVGLPVLASQRRPSVS